MVSKRLPASALPSPNMDEPGSEMAMLRVSEMARLFCPSLPPYVIVTTGQLPVMVYAGVSELVPENTYFPLASVELATATISSKLALKTLLICLRFSSLAAPLPACTDISFIWMMMLEMRSREVSENSRADSAAFVLLMNWLLRASDCEISRIRAAATGSSDGVLTRLRVESWTLSWLIRLCWMLTP